MEKVNTEIETLKKKSTKKHTKKVLNRKEIKEELKRLQDQFVFVPTDKASNNISIVCKQFYVHTMLKELKVFDDTASSKTYEKVTKIPFTASECITSVINDHDNKLKDWKICLDSEAHRLPFMYWIPKMHKTPSKQRFIAASACCSTKELSATITKCLNVIDSYHEHTAHNMYAIVVFSVRL